MKSLSLCLSLLCCLPVMAAEVQTRTDPDTGLLSWKLEERGFSLEFIQLLPNYVRALYGSRGFSKPLIEGIARYCVFGSVAMNTSDQPLSYRVKDWRYHTVDGKSHPLKTKTEWVADWKKAGIPYNWSILPDDQAFEVGDWSQGFTTVLVPWDQPFDLEYSWTIGEKTHVAKLEGMRCAIQE